MLILENHQAQPKALHPAPVPHKVTPVAYRPAEPWMYLGLHRAQRNEREKRVSTVAQAARQVVPMLTGVGFTVEVLPSPVPVLVLFGASGSEICDRSSPLTEDLAADYRGRAKVVQVDVDANPELTERFGIRGLPTFLLFKEGREVDRVIGVVPREELTERLDAVLSSQSAFVPSVFRLRLRQLLPR